MKDEEEEDMQVMGFGKITALDEILKHHNHE